MKNRFNQGFTLIELLVVIAIIGILSSVVLASLNTARAKGSDAAIKADVAGIRAAAEIVYDTNSGAYAKGAGVMAAMSAACGAIANVAAGSATSAVSNDPTVQKQIDDAIVKNGNVEAKCQATASDYVVAVPLKTSAASAWCVDGHGNSQAIVFATLATDMDCSLVAASL